MENKKFGALSSSVDPQKLSKTVEGLILMAAAFLAIAGKWIGFPLLDGQIAVLAEGLGLATGFIWALWGFLRKLVVRFAGN